MKKRSTAFIWFMVFMLLLCAAGVYLLLQGVNAPTPAPPPMIDPGWRDYARG